MNGQLDTGICRRAFLTQAIAAGLCAGSLLAAEQSRLARMGLTIASCGLRSRQQRGGPRGALDFLKHCQELGGGGIQVGVGGWTLDLAKELRQQAEANDLYLEGQTRLPTDRSDLDRFEAELRVAREAGVDIFRVVALNTRRYETFETLERFREFQRRSWESLTLAEPVAGRLRARIAIENHKDWRVPELLDILQKLSSEHVGVCVDTGNSIALLEEPGAVVEAYAPHAITTHFKDMAVQAQPEGFLLSEVPLGEGFLDLPAMVAALRRANPKIRFNLEMITRDPLSVPCLSSMYYATMPELPAQTLAQALHQLRVHPPSRPLPRTSGLSREQQVALEEAHNKRCFGWAQSQIR
jgi:sugar phosphate isomerase/epimerase